MSRNGTIDSILKFPKIEKHRSTSTSQPKTVDAAISDIIKAQCFSQRATEEAASKQSIQREDKAKYIEVQSDVKHLGQRQQNCC